MKVAQMLNVLTVQQVAMLSHVALVAQIPLEMARPAAHVALLNI